MYVHILVKFSASTVQQITPTNYHTVYTAFFSLGALNHEACLVMRLFCDCLHPPGGAFAGIAKTRQPGRRKRCWLGNRE